MAFVRLAAAAQQREAMLGRAAEELVDRLREGGLPGHLVVEGVAFGVELVSALWPPAERQAQE